MNVSAVVKSLHRQYPGKKIVINTPDDPQEIICEIDPAGLHPSISTAIAVVDRIRPHYHRNLTEVYEVIRGSLILYRNSAGTAIMTGQKFRILPGTVHWAEGSETWLRVVSSPGWTATDHYFVINPKRRN